MDRRAFLTIAACSAVSASSVRIARAQATPRFYEAARYSSDRGGSTLVVVRNGVVLGEDYPGGPPETHWPIGAATRAFAPLLAALMVKDRLIGLDELVAVTIGDWSAHPVKSTISIRALLSGASGLAFARNDQHDVVTALALEPTTTPGAQFADDAAAYVIFAELAHRKLTLAGLDPDPAMYLTERVFTPLDCTPAWQRGADGAARFDDGAALAARDWASIGELMRRGGVWRAEQLVSEAALSDMLHGSFLEPRAGFGFWFAAANNANRPLPFNSDIWRPNAAVPADLAMAAGDAGQRLYMAPSRNLVIARQTRGPSPNVWSDTQFLSLIANDL
jgi:CubicO group peptidase (beta-lactamase class C family)